MIVAHLDRGIDVSIKISSDWPLCSYGLKLISIRNSGDRPTNIASTLLSKTKVKSCCFWSGTNAYTHCTMHARMCFEPRWSGRNSFWNTNLFEIGSRPTLTSIRMGVKVLWWSYHQNFCWPLNLFFPTDCPAWNLKLNCLYGLASIEHRRWIGIKQPSGMR
jgi:hypothetical protein